MPLALWFNPPREKSDFILFVIVYNARFVHRWPERVLSGPCSVVVCTDGTSFIPLGLEVM